MPKVMQNLVLLMDPSVAAYDISLKAGNMFLNRFCIDEDAAFESSGVYNLFQNGKNTLNMTKNSVLAKGLRKSVSTHFFI